MPLSSSLTEAEQHLLRTIAVFAGSFSLEAAQSVLAEEPIALSGSTVWGRAPERRPPGAPTSQLVGMLRDLAKLGVIHRIDAPTGSIRYVLPQPLRHEALVELTQCGEIESARTKHAHYILDFVESIDGHVWGAEHAYWMTRLEAEEENVRATLDWAAETQHHELSLRLATGLWLFWQTRGRVTEGRFHLDRALQSNALVAPDIRGAGLIVDALLAWIQHDDQRAELSIQEAISLWRRCEFTDGLGRALFVSGLIAWHLGDESRVRSSIGEAIEYFKAYDDFVGLPLCLIVLAIAARQQGEHAQALSLLEEAAGLSEYGSFVWGVAAARYYEGEVLTDLNDFTSAADSYRISMSISMELGDPWTTGAGIGGLATIGAMCGQPDLAARLFGAANAMCSHADAMLPVMDRDHHLRVIEAIRNALGDARFEHAYAEGASMLQAQAIEAAKSIAVPNPSRLTARTLPDPARAPDAAVTQLSPREMQVLNLLVDGVRDADIARNLKLSTRTVSDYVISMRKKFDLPSRTALAVYAVRSGLVEV